jgi:hypothetical protein
MFVISTYYNNRQNLVALTLDADGVPVFLRFQ